MALLAPERHDRILARLRTRTTATVQEISDELEVTKETVRRDLDALERAGSLERIHGGAVLAGSGVRAETPWRERQSRRAEQKRAIATAALDFLPPSSGSALLDAGTTTEALADLLADDAAVPPAAEGGIRAVITDAVPIAQTLADRPHLDLEVLGGQVRGITGAVVGDQALATLAARRVDVAFLGTNGLDAAFGLSTPDAAEAAVKAAMIRSARRSVLLADATKHEVSSLVRVAELSALDVLITDAEPPAALRAALDEAEVEVVIAR
ncbi:DeoR/GlpR family DNA-binding transcription regulator [Nesterenkonia halophila]|uniref:DeoR/GlpR family DNA-binding transcription regulator n=1 Tax=Nesterenkonia halophila TaxID=302044 RepID=UPI0012919B6D|nr:DeoR/GlpR family DNA-binding transcription regulator [Nesterenkonia halophila]